MEFNFYNIKEIQNFITDNNLSIQKKFGQNFLVNENICGMIVETAKISSGDLVIEIGCGLGSLTNKILKTGCNLIGFEIDCAFIKHLKKIFTTDKFTLIEGDFLKKSKEIFKTIDKDKFDRIIILGNLPYYITKPIFEKVFTSDLDFDIAGFMIQKEVGEKILTREGNEKYSYLSIISQVNKEIETLTDVSPDYFYPSPNVESVILFFRKSSIPFQILDKKLFYNLSQSLFINRRKKLKNNLLLSPFLTGTEKEISAKALNNVNISGDIRGECLTINQIVNLSNEITNLLK